MNTDIQKQESTEGGTFSIESFEHAQRIAKMLSSSSLIPVAYQNNIQNTMIAMEMANRIGASPLMVMQNLNVIQGKPSWGSSFIIAVLNARKGFSNLSFTVTGTGMEMECEASCKDLSTGETITGPPATMKMAEAEGWISKSGSKWKTMPALMIRYRAAAFFGRLYAPELLMGMHTEDEVYDIGKKEKINAYDDLPPVNLEELNSIFKIQRAYVGQQITADQMNELISNLKDSTDGK